MIARKRGYDTIIPIRLTCVLAVVCAANGAELKTVFGGREWRLSPECRIEGGILTVTVPKDRARGLHAPETFRYLSPLTLTNIIYQVHMYSPSDFTHQRVMDKRQWSVAYPNVEKGWNIDYLRNVMKPVREFQFKHKARIYVGEFSAVAWAEGAERYLDDCIEMFEEYGWDWSYHAFREWAGWSVEHEGTNANSLRPSADNPRKRVLLKGFRRK